MKIVETNAQHVWSKPFYGPVEYKMTKLFAKRLLDSRKGEDAKMPPQKFLCDYVNKTGMVKGKCVRVLTDL